MNKEFEVLFDISENETPDYQEFCPINVGKSENVTTDTWYTICSEIANNETRAIDPQWDFNAKFEQTDPVAQFIMNKEYKTGLARTGAIKLVNHLKGANGKQITFIANFDDITYDITREAKVEISFAVKVHRGSTFLEEDYTGA